MMKSLTSFLSKAAALNVGHSLRVEPCTPSASQLVLSDTSSRYESYAHTATARSCLCFKVASKTQLQQ